MARKHKPEEIIGKLREAEIVLAQGGTVADACRWIGVTNGNRVVVSTAFGRVETDLAIDNDLGRGTVALTHGFGHTHSFALTVAQEHPGVNSNALMPFGAEQFEPLSHMSWISGVPVTVKLADTPTEKSAPADLQVALAACFCPRRLRDQ